MISKTGIHAIRAMVALAELPEGEYAGAGTIAETIGAPRNYLGKLLQMFSHVGFVESQKGMGGGFRLAVDPSKISLLDIVDPIDHINRWSGCILGRNQCSDDNPCALHNRWKNVRDQYIRLLEDTSISELVNNDEVLKQIA